ARGEDWASDSQTFGAVARELADHIGLCAFRVFCVDRCRGTAMEVILREHVDNLGRRGEVVKVADGYARNYLLPRKLALIVTEGNKKQIERERVKFDAKELEEKGVADAMSQRLGNVELEISRKV